MAELKIKADSGGGTVALKGPATTTSNAAVQLTLPVDDGTANQYLKTDGSGALSWATVTDTDTDTLSFCNLIINGAMKVAQRGTSSTTNGYGSVDRWKVNSGGTDEAVTHAQHALTSSDTGPWAKGFRYSLHLTNGNQTSGAGAADFIEVDQEIEAQDIVQSGWAYTDSNSKITLSFWIKSSVAQNFYGYLRVNDNTKQLYCIETGSLSADTWTKVTKTIPGAAANNIDNDAGAGILLRLLPFYGTNMTGTRPLNAWAAYDSAARTPDSTTTWYTTNDATFEITGVQLEVGDTATDFEHRSYGEELVRCLRYYQTEEFTANYQFIMMTIANTTSTMQGFNTIPYPMRVDPTITHNGVGNFRLNDWSGGDATCTALAFEHITKLGARWSFNKNPSSGNGFTVRYGGYINTEGGNDAAVYYDAEL